MANIREHVWSQGPKFLEIAEIRRCVDCKITIVKVAADVWWHWYRRRERPICTATMPNCR